VGTDDGLVRRSVSEGGGPFLLFNFYFLLYKLC
jgi:hypothetical protein